MTRITDKTVKSKYPPKQTNVTWIDTSQKPAVTKSYIDGQWVVVGGGVTDYNDIKNKPTINGVELVGDKLFSDLTNGLLFGGEITTQTVVTPDTSCYYIVNGAGTYEAFGVTVYGDEHVQILTHNGTSWEAQSIHIYTYAYAHGKFDTLDDIDSRLDSIVPDSASSSNKLLTENERHFKGWFDDTTALNAKYPSPVVGDYAYIPDASPATTASIYKCATAGTWADSGFDVDTSNVQTFASGEEVNETPIDNTHLINPADGALPTATDVMQLKAKLEGVTAEETKAANYPIAPGIIACRDYSTTRVTGHYYNTSGNTTKIAFVALGASKGVRFLGLKVKNANYIVGYVYLNIADIDTFLSGLTDGDDLAAYIVGGVHPFEIVSTQENNTELFEIISSKPEGANYVALFYDTNQNSGYAVKDTNFYCYLQSGESVIDLISGPEKKYFSFNYTGGFGTDGKFNGSNSYNCTDYIRIIGGEEIYGYSNSYRTVVQFYDKGFNFISALNPTDGAMCFVSFSSITIPENAYYFRAGTLGTAKDKSFVRQNFLPDFLDKYRDNIINLPDTQEKVLVIDDVFLSYDATITNKWLRLGFKAPKSSFSVFVGCENPPVSSFKLYTTPDNTSTLNLVTNNAKFNEWIPVTIAGWSEPNNQRIYLVADVESESINVPIVIKFSNGNQESSLVSSVEQLISSVEQLALYGKNIVVFGDSISDFKDDAGKGWSDYASEESGATFIDCAIGGTQLRQRRAEITLFDANKTYNIGDWVYYKPSTTMNCYNCVNQHTGEWDANDFEEVTYNYFPYATLDIINLIRAACNTTIPTYADRFVNQEAAAQCIKDHYGANGRVIARVNILKSIDWTKVDAVIIMAGTNDFTELQPGTSGSTNINKTYGAINEMTRLLCSTYSNVALYYNSILVRWYDYASGVGADEKWGDVYIPTGGTQTLKQFAESCMDEFRNNHIPVLDLYNTLGWNKFNFSNFFRSNDGTHPYKGFRQISEKIVGFLVSNKTF